MTSIDSPGDELAGSETISPEACDRIERLLGSAALRPLVQRLDQRFGKRDDLAGSVSLADMPEETIDAISGLLGRPPSRSRRVTIRVSDLDAAVASATGVGLASALTVILGRPPVHLPSQRREKRERWDRARRRWLSGWSDTPPDILRLLESCPGTADLRRTTGDDLDAAFEIVDGLRRCLLPLPITPPVSLPIFATETLGDAHGLDAGHPLHRLLRDAIGILHGDLPPGEEIRTRDVFGSVGIVLDELSSTVLVLNLRPRREHALAEFLNQSAAAGEPCRLTFRQLQRYPLAFDAGHGGVHVCENPSIMTTAADRLAGRCLPLICVEGFPSHAALLLIDELARCQIPMLYHGDFDASGLQIAAQMILGKSMRSWRMNASDYESSVAFSNISLSGNQPIIETPWDRRLGACLRTNGKSVIEEMVLDSLIEDLNPEYEAP